MFTLRVLSRIVCGEQKQLWNRYRCTQNLFDTTQIATPKILEQSIEKPLNIYKDTSAEYGIGRKYVLQKFGQLFNLKPYAVELIAKKYSKLKKVTGKTMSDNYDLCKLVGVSDDTILKFPELLAQKDLEVKVTHLQRFGFNLDGVIPLALLTPLLFKRLCLQHDIDSSHIPGGRIQFLVSLFNVPLQEMCATVVTRPFLSSVPIQNIQEVYNILLGFGITEEEIIKDYWVFKYTSGIVRHRLNYAKTLNVDKFKSWMIRAKPDIIDAYVKRRYDNKMVLGDNSLVEYLAERLDCTIEEVKFILSKHPPLCKKNITKIKEMIDFIYDQGFKPIHIIRNPKILLHSVETSSHRMKELQSQGLQMDSLYVLTKSQKQYMSFYEGLLKMNKMKDSV